MRDQRMPSGQIVPPGLRMRPEPVQIRRQGLIVLLIAAAFVGLIARLVQLQILGGGESRILVERMGTSYDTIRGLRGDILTRDRTILAREVLEYTVAIDPQVVSRENLQPLIDFLSRGLGLADEERRTIQSRLRDRMEKAARGEGLPPRFLVFRRGVPAGLVREIGLGVDRILPRPERRAVIFQPIHFRQYPRGSLAGSVVGACIPGPNGDDLTGAEGIELSYDASLTSVDGKRKLRCEGRRMDRWYQPGEVDIHAVNGYNLVLTIDSRIQGIAEEELERGLEKEKADAGCAIVMDCRNGDILAMVNLPSLDPNHYHDYPKKEFDERRRNRAIECEFEPGSTIKPFIAAVALEKRLFQPDQTIWGGGRVNRFLGRRLVQDVSDHGRITFSEAVIYSSNIGMTHVGLQLGRDGLNEVLDRFHFQRKTGIPFPGEAPGWRQERRKWSEAYTSISVSFGYELRVTPIQLTQAFASLVNGGRLFAPRIVERLERGEEVVEVPVQEMGRSIQVETSRKMRDILVEVVERGTAKACRIPGFRYGGKTGTRISAGRNGEFVRDCLSTFIAFAPAEDPQIVASVFVERPKVHHYGSTVAGPVVAGILKRIFHVEEDQEPRRAVADSRRR